MDFQRLKEWFQRERRELPWRKNPTPYDVWVSEVMLQQTQVSVVIPYFERWMKRFPTVNHLAKASLDDVIKLWEGLGYYSRARNLLEGARYILRTYKGKIPEKQEELAKIKGLGPYTIGAICSFAFHQKVATVDGNVLRVINRYFHLEDDIAKAKTVRKIRNMIEDILPDEESWIINEALIELGATVCGKTPKCNTCPLKKSCKSHINGVAKNLPIKSTTSQTQKLYRDVAVIFCGNLLLVKRGQAGHIMQDLHEFPYFETTKQGMTVDVLIKRISKDLALNVTFIKTLPQITQTFTRYRVSLTPKMFTVKKPKTVTDYQWLSSQQLENLAFSSGHRKILKIL